MILLLCLVGLILFLVHQFWYRLLNLPRGPLPFPLIGNVGALCSYERWEDKLLEWKQQYGKMYTIWMGSMPLVTINDYKLAVDLFIHKGNNFEERQTMYKFQNAARGGVYGIIDTFGELWRENRRFCLKTLRDFGLGKNKMQDRILEEIQTIFENVNKDINSGIVEHDFHKHTDLATGSVINAIICGYRFSANGKEDEFYKMKHLTKSIMTAFSDPLLNLAIHSDFLLKLPIIKPRFDHAINLFHKVFEFLDGIIDEHTKQNDYLLEFEPHDFIDAYLSEIHKNEEFGETHYFSRKQLTNVCFDLWFAGQETTSATISWAIAYLICHLDVQQKLHDELDRVIGTDRMITVSDKTQLPYTQAIIMEVQRLANIVVVNLPRKAAKDMVIEGQLIERGTIFVPQMSVMMADPMNFNSPKEFNPSRFIDENENFVSSDKVIPFSLGKRQCLGESLARMELFLFIANIFNQYKITSATEPPTLKRSVSGISPDTKPYKCCAHRRFPQ